MKSWANFRMVLKTYPFQSPFNYCQSVLGIPPLLFINCICLVLLLGACDRDASLEEEETEKTTVPTTLAKQDFPLDNLSSFSSASDAWAIAGNAFASITTSDFSVEEGTGALVCTNGANTLTPISTQMEHGDLEMDLEFLLPKNGQGQLWLQGRYAIQLEDTWGGESRRCGMLVGSTSAEDRLAPVNASRAPGLWQHLSLYFEAARFDSDGKKISDAKLHYLRLNGYTLLENVDLTAPSAGASATDEVAEAPFVFASQSGAVAFRNIHYKAYTLDQLQVSNIQYKLYQGDWDRLPNLDTMTVSSSGTKEDFDVEMEGYVDKYAMSFSAQLEVPVAGEYLFETRIDDGGDLFIDGELLIHNDGEPGMGTERNLITLTEGSHTIDLSYYQDVWGKRLLVFYEGPSIKRQSLGAKETAEGPRRGPKKMVVNPTDGPELIRSFVNHKGEKRNFPISVGSPLGVHFTFDLEEGTLLHAWRGAFADVTNMWVGRGHSQLLIPGNASAQVSTGVSVAELASTSGTWPSGLPEGYSIDGYDLDADGYPIFKYQFEGMQFSDQVLPTSEGNIERTITVAGGTPQASHYARLATGQIEALESGWFRIDGEYYIDVDEATVGGTNNELLLVPLEGKESVTYHLIW
ncbi:MAG: DUF1080 domain-containing protein [Saprospiraceae bacterium]|nr:DUF1080 domain-containing protein [Saprospiraceae bacterium]